MIKIKREINLSPHPEVNPLHQVAVIMIVVQIDVFN